MARTAAASRRRTAVGSPRPRLGPPTPLHHGLKEFREAAESVGLALMPWQETAARYITARNAAGHPLYREVAVIVARQNGKTTLLLPLVLERLREGRRVVHAAQSLRMPGMFHRELATLIETRFPAMLPRRRGVSWRAGQESITCANGGTYQIVAASGGAPRGLSADLVIVDELREMTDDRFMSGIKPTTMSRPEGQVVYLSNMGTDESVVLNSLRLRRDDDPRLAYLEWSADPDYDADDERGWLQANPAIGHIEPLLPNLRDEHRAALLGGTMPSFETENLCRRVATRRRPLVDPGAWEACAGVAGVPRGAVLGLALDPDGRRASGVIAWKEGQGVAVRVLADVTGSPIDLDAFGPDLARLAQSTRVASVVFDPYSEHLARHFRRASAMSGRDFVNASGTFARMAESGALVHDGADAVTADLPYTTRKSVGPGAFMAAQALPDRPVTAAMAAVRAVGALYGPRPAPPRIL